MLRKSRKWTILLLFVLVANSLVGCKKPVEIDGYQKTSNGEIQRVEQILENIRNKDGGYHEILNTDLYRGDVLYFTYYSLMALEKIGCSESLEDNVLKKTICNSSIESFVKENYFDNLSNIYYFVEINRILNLHIDEKNAVFIKEYVSGLQTDEGCFALSDKQKQKIDNKQYKAGEYNETVLGTFMALEILTRVGSEEYDKERVTAWIESKFYELKENPTYEQLPYIMLLVKIDNTIGKDDTEHKKLLEVIYKSSLDYLELSYSEYNCFDVFFMNDVLETSILLGKSDEFIAKTKYMASYYSVLQKDEGGCFGADGESESNILPTYCAITYYDLAGIKEYRREIIEETIRKSKTIEGYYLPIMERASNSESTYYAYKILEMIQSQSDYKVWVKEFVSNLEVNTLCQNQTELLFYYRLNDELYGTNELSSTSAELIQELKVSLLENELSNHYLCFQVLNSLETLEMFEENVDGEICEKIIRRIKNRGGEKTEQGFLMECYELLILKLLGLDGVDEVITEKTKRVKDTMVEGYQEMDQEYRLFCLYWGIRSLNAWSVEVAELLDLELIKEEIRAHENNAMYSIGIDDYPSLSSTYYCLYILDNIEGKQNQ